MTKTFDHADPDGRLPHGAHVRVLTPDWMAEILGRVGETQKEREERCFAPFVQAMNDLFKRGGRW